MSGVVQRPSASAPKKSNPAKNLSPLTAAQLVCAPSGLIEGRHLEASDDGAGCGARGRETNAPPKHSGGAGAPPGGQYEPPARSWLTGAASAACRKALTVKATQKGPCDRRGTTGEPSKPNRKARPGAAVPLTTVGEAEEDGPQMSPGRPNHCLGGAPGGAFRIFVRRCGSISEYGSAPWRAIPSYPEGAPS
jgi:hypothetical protein